MKSQLFGLLDQVPKLTHWRMKNILFDDGYHTAGPKRQWNPVALALSPKVNLCG